MTYLTILLATQLKTEEYVDFRKIDSFARLFVFAILRKNESNIISNSNPSACQSRSQILTFLQRGYPAGDSCVVNLFRPSAS